MCLIITYFKEKKNIINDDKPLFIVDIGLLSALCYLNSEIIINNNNIFTEFKGSLTEQFVLQELKTHDDLLINYWTNNNGNAEIDFIIQKQTCDGKNNLET